MGKVFIVDGSGYIFRAYYAVPPLSTRDGFPTNALFGYTKMLTKLLAGADTQHVVVVFDAGQKTFRNELYPEYKANRKECPDDLGEQFPHFRTISRALGLPVYELAGFEADDVIGTLSSRLTAAGHEVVVVTGDKDLMQLVGGKLVIWDTMKDKWYDPQGVKEKFGVPPEKVVEFLGLTGDSSDNIPGLSGVGPKTAVQLIEKFGDVETILSSAEAIKADPEIRNRKKIAEQVEFQAAEARLSRRLVEIDKNAPVLLALEGKEVSLSEMSDDKVYAALSRGTPDYSTLKTLGEKFEFSSLFQNIKDPNEVAQSSAHEKYCTVLAADFDAFLSELKAQEEFAIDTETTSLDVLEAELVGVSFCWSDEKAWYVPLRAKDVAGLVKEAEFVAALKPILENAAVKKYGQNLKYDSSVFARLGILLRAIAFDTMVAAYVLNPDRGSYNLTTLSNEFLGRSVIEFDDVVGENATFGEVDLASATKYACQDAHFAWLLVKHLEPKIKAQELERVFYEIEMPLVPILAAMERRGILLDIKLLNKMSEELGVKLEAIKIKLFELAGGEFNINSPKQLADILFNKLKIPTKGIKKTKTGISTDSSVLEKLAKEHPLAELILQYRMLFKLKSTYVDTLPAEVSTRDGRLHTKFNQTGTGTGRLSSSEPNLQNIPVQTEEGRRIRGAFIAEEGKSLVSADYSQIELRLLAHMSGDPTLIQTFRDGVDVHTRTAQELLGITDPAQVTAEQRRIGKTINFGVIYGMGPFRLAKELEIPVNIATRYIDDYFARYPGVQAFFKKVEEEAMSRGVVSTLFGRKRILSELDTAGRDQGFVLRAAINAPIQGTAADLIKIAMIRVEERLRSEKAPATMLLQIHDELLFECEQSFVPQIEVVLRCEMEQALALSVPLKVEVGNGRTWQEAHA